MKNFLVLLAGLAASLLAGCSEPPFPIEPEAHAAEVRAWQAGRAERLTSENGWLTLVGLCWLDRGNVVFGSHEDAGCHIDKPGIAPQVGTFDVRREGVLFMAAPGATVTTADGKPVGRIGMSTDRSGEPTVLAHGSLRFYVIERADRLGLRIRDLESDAVKDFEGLDYFPIDMEWRKVARFEPWPGPRSIGIMNILGMREELPSPGQLVFEHDGEEHRLVAVADEDDPTWFLMMADATSGKETYGAGRYIYVDAPRMLADGRVLTLIDFNKVYNPPCAFTALATCPLPPMSNRLDIAITAGEKNYESEDGWKGDY